ncbi:MAG TPA: hypothetical protein PKA63_08235 [Oligoflexia bacterium]|nr:hypothetical protein [Oligoflexia bacterium]HMP48639.1 hypothetical protein [Oligoflexia bacterium]
MALTLPFIKEGAATSKNMESSDEGMILDIRGLDEYRSGDRVRKQDLFRLSGHVSGDDNHHNLRGQDSPDTSSFEDDNSLTSQHIIQYSLATSFSEYRAVIGNGYRVVHNLHKDLSPFIKENAPNVSPIEILRNPAFEFESLFIGFERYQFRSRIAKWCKVPTVDFRFKLSLSIGGFLMRGEIARDAGEDIYHQMKSYLELVGKYFG